MRSLSVIAELLDSFATATFIFSSSLLIEFSFYFMKTSLARVGPTSTYKKDPAARLLWTVVDSGKQRSAACLSDTFLRRGAAALHVGINGVEKWIHWIQCWTNSERVLWSFAATIQCTWESYRLLMLAYNLHSSCRRRSLREEGLGLAPVPRTLDDFQFLHPPKTITT